MICSGSFLRMIILTAMVEMERCGTVVVGFIFLTFIILLYSLFAILFRHYAFLKIVF